MLNWKFSIIILFCFFISLTCVTASSLNNSTEILQETGVHFIENETLINNELNLQENQIDFHNGGVYPLDSDYWQTNNATGEGYPTVYENTSGNQILGNGIPTVITANNVVKYYGGTGSINAYLKDNTGNPLVNKNLVFSIGGTSYNKVTDSNGCGSLYIGLWPGSYTITVSFSETGYISSSKSVSVTVNKMPTSITASNLVKYYMDDNNLNSILKDNTGTGLANKNVVYTLGSTTYDRTTSSNGQSSLYIGLWPGTCTITISFSAKGYVSSSKSVTVTVNNMPTTITAANLVKYYNGNGSVNAYLKDINNNPLSNKQVTFSVANTVYERTTDSDGLFSIFIGFWPGDHTITASFSARGYVSSSKTIQITVNPMPVHIVAENLICSPIENNILNVSLLDYYNNPLTSKSLTLTLSGSTYTGTTNSEGVTNFNINKNPGNYNGEISFSQRGYVTSAKNILITVLNAGIPFVNYDSGTYDTPYLYLKVFLNGLNSINYSWNNINWTQIESSTSFSLPDGVYDFYYGLPNSIYHKNYTVDSRAPIAWSNYYSDVYSQSIIVNLSSWDNIDENCPIYYTLNGENPLVNGILYNNPLTISLTTTLKFYSKDNINHCSSIYTYNYIFAQVGNLNSGKGFTSIQSAIDDPQTVDGDTIKVSNGLYEENIQINKCLNLICECATLKSANSSVPVISITPDGSNSSIYGFNIINSDLGIVIWNASNVTIAYNNFSNVLTSIWCDGDDNTLIAYNNITSSYLPGITSISIRKSHDLIIYGNIIDINSNSYAVGIMFESTLASNISILDNKIRNRNSKNGIGIYAMGSNFQIEYNDISNFNVGSYIQQLSESIISNNNIYDCSNGLFLKQSSNNAYKSNNFIGNAYCGVILDNYMVSFNDSFYLNRLCGNGLFDLYSLSSIPYLINDNWWGEVPNVSTSQYVSANIYNSTGNLIMDSWIEMKFFTASYTVNENSFIDRINVILDLNYNNLNQDLSRQGHIPDGCIASIWYLDKNNNLNMYNESLSNGYACFDLNVSNLMDYNNNSVIFSLFDSYNITFAINKKASIDLYLFSSAFDYENNCGVDFNMSVDYCDISWITYSWRETGLFKSQINIIVNGVLVETFNVTNAAYDVFKNDYGENVFRSIKFFNEFFASTKEGIWEPNGYFMNFINDFNLNSYSYSDIYELFLLWLKANYSLSDLELNFVVDYHTYFVDYIDMYVDYHGDFREMITFEYNNTVNHLNPPSSFAHRMSRIYYSNIEDSDGDSIGYEGMRSFAVVKSNVTDDDLRYWLNQKNNFSPGMMKAAYGTFLTSLLVIYENDRVADDAASKFNVTWSRVSPACVSLCNDFNCLYITGESDHGMGRKAIGNDSDVWKFNFATTFSFSFVEQLVGNNVWNTTKIGSVTLGLIESYMNNETLEIFISNGHLFIKREEDNSTLLFLDLKTGIVRDYFSNYGLLGTMPCYHNNITENAWNYGNNLLNIANIEYNDLKSAIIYAIDSVFLKTDIDEYIPELESFLTNLIIGFAGSELVSAGIVLVAGGVISGDTPLSILGGLIFFGGEYALLYSDGLLDGDITYIDATFFVLDNFLVFIGPLSGGLKVGNQITKFTIEQMILSKGGKIATIVNVDINEELIRYNPIELILKNNYDETIEVLIKNFFDTTLLPSVFKSLLDEN